MHTVHEKARLKGFSQTRLGPKASTQQVPPNATNQPPLRFRTSDPGACRMIPTQRIPQRLAFATTKGILLRTAMMWDPVAIRDHIVLAGCLGRAGIGVLHLLWDELANTQYAAIQSQIRRYISSQFHERSLIGWSSKVSNGKKGGKLKKHQF